MPQRKDQPDTPIFTKAQIEDWISVAEALTPRESVLRMMEMAHLALEQKCQLEVAAVTHRVLQHALRRKECQPQSRRRS